MVGKSRILARGQILELDQVLLEPLPVGLGLGEALLDLLVGNDAAFLGIDKKDASGLEAALRRHLLGGYVENADLGRHDDEVVLRHVVAARAQPVAVENGADLRAVGESDRRGAVPRLHQARVVFVEGLAVGRHPLVVGPRLGNHHDCGVGERAPGEDEKLEAVVEHGRVAAVGVDDRLQRLDVIAKERRCDLRLARVHPVDVAAQGVDLAVVRDKAVGMRTVPAGKCVGAEARMDQRQSAFHAGVGQVGIVLRDLRRGEHAFVNERAGRKARDVEKAAASHAPVADLVEEAVADHVELALEFQTVLDRRAAPDERHEHVGLLRFGGFAQVGVVGRHRAPTEEFLPLGPDDLLEEPLDIFAQALVGREKHHGHPVIAGRRKLDVLLLGHRREELVRSLDENARAIAGVFLEPAGAAVLEIEQNLQPLFDDLVGRPPLQVGNETHTAGFVLELRIVKSLALRLFHGRFRWLDAEER